MMYLRLSNMNRTRQALAALLLSCMAYAPHADATTQTIALTGQQAPGAQTGQTFLSFETPTLNHLGQVAFHATLEGTGATNLNNVGIWTNRSGTLELVFQAGDDAPGLGPGITFHNQFDDSPRFNDNGQIAIRTRITGPGVDGDNSNTIWLFGPDTDPTLLVWDGSPAPGTPRNYTGIGDYDLNNAGQVVFRGSVNDDNEALHLVEEAGLWIASPGSLQLVHRGGPIPGLLDGADVSAYNNSGPDINDQGHVIWSATLAGDEIDSHVNDEAMMRWDGSAFSVMSQLGTPLAGEANNALMLGYTSAPVYDASGNAMFIGVVSGSPDPLAVVWREDAQVLIQEGDAAAGPGGATLLITPTRFPSTHSSGLSSITANFSTPDLSDSGRGIFTHDGIEPYHLLVRNGDAAPFIADGAVFHVFNANAINQFGQVQFHAEIDGAGVNSGKDEGIWVVDPDGELHLIVAQDQWFDVDDDPLVEDLRQIRDLRLATGPEWNNQDVVYWLRFADGSEGIFTTTVPEPGSLALLGLGGIALLRRRRA